MPTPKRISRKKLAPASARQQAAQQPTYPPVPTVPPVQLPELSDTAPTLDAPKPPAVTRRGGHWRRSFFLASAAFNVVFWLFTLSGMRFSYAPPPPEHRTHAPLLVQLAVEGLFWGALLLSTCADVALACGWWQRCYHRLLHLALACSVFVAAFLAAIETIYSIREGAGYSEPLTWLLVAVLQALVIQSAHNAEPPQAVHLPGVAGLIQLVMRSPSARWYQALHDARLAFWHTLYAPELEPVEPPESVESPEGVAASGDGDAP